MTKTTFLVDYGSVSPGYASANTQILSEPEPPDAGRAGHLMDEQVPPLAGDPTLLAVVPIPGTGSSLAIVGYVMTTSAEPPGPAAEAGSETPAGQPSPVTPPLEAISRPDPEPDGLRLNYGQRRVWADGHEIELTFREFELLAFLSTHPATVFTRAELVEQVWHRAPAHDSRAIARDSRTVDVHVSRVRRKLGPRHARCLVTEYRVGYQFRQAP